MSVCVILREKGLTDCHQICMCIPVITTAGVMDSAMLWIYDNKRLQYLNLLQQSCSHQDAEVSKKTKKVKVKVKVKVRGFI